MPLILGTNSIKDTGYEVDNSVRLNGTNAYMNRTLGTATNRKKFTFSFWYKRELDGTHDTIAGWDSGGNLFEEIKIQSDQLKWTHRTSGGTSYTVQTNRIFRDPSAFYHLVIALDTTQATDSNRVKIYVNGSQETSLATSNYPAQDLLSEINNNNDLNLFRWFPGSDYTGGYVSELVFIDGQALDPTSFGEFDSNSPNIWKPIDVSDLTFGTNGFHLDFENASSLGADVSGNSNNFTVNNLTSIDQTTDTCTNNFITLNPIITNTNRTNAQTYSEGNTISIPNSHDSYMTASSTIGLKGSGKWYWESQIVWNGTASNAYYPRTIGFVSEDYPYSASYMGQADESWCIIYQASGGPGWRFGHNGSESNISGATSLANGDTMIFALDLDNGKFYAGRNGTWFTSGDPTSGSTGTGALATLSASDLAKFLFPACTNASNATYYKWNFGNAAYSISSGNSDGNGYGNFEYSVPSGYYAINTKNLAEYG